MDLDPVALRGVTDLTLAVQQEERLLEALRSAMLRQREAVARGDGPGVETSLRLAGRALLTLQDARRHRAAVLQRLVGDPAQPLMDLDARFAEPLPEAFLAARSRMRRLATETAGEVWRSQELLLDGLREREALLQELLTGARPAGPGRPAATAEGSSESSGRRRGQVRSEACPRKAGPPRGPPGAR